jgi:hypothetical protein
MGGGREKYEANKFERPSRGSAGTEFLTSTTQIGNRGSFG